MTHEECLARAERELAASAAEVVDTFRLHYHFMPPAQWMNDPNGLVYFEGYYHVFYQHHPFGSAWGPMYWGHARSRDLITSEHLPIALAPSEDYDAAGCFSGSAVEAEGVLHLFYTGVREKGGQLVQVQCRATSTDGIHFEKDPSNPLIGEPPSDGSVDFRDPKVWRHGGRWYMAVGSGKDGGGRVLLYRSDNLSSWDYMGVLAESDGTQGSMWECPDVFPLGSKHVLLVSPMGTRGRRVIYFLGEMDYEAGRFTPESWGELDKGPDFYASQTFYGTERRILLAWMQSWEGRIPTQEHRWAGALTLPRELALDPAGRLRVYPAAEAAGLRIELLAADGLVLNGETAALPPCDLRSSGVELVLGADGAAVSGGELAIRFKDMGSGEWVTVGIRGQRLYLDTRAAAWGERGSYSSGLAPEQRSQEVRIFLDRSSLEVFGEGEAACITARIYPPSGVLEAELSSRGGPLKVDLAMWKLQARS